MHALRWAPAFVALLICTALVGWTPSPVFAQTAYNDVSPDHWSYQALSYLQAEEVLQGFPKGHFNGSQTLVRYEFAQGILSGLANNVEEDSEHGRSIELILRALVNEYADQLCEVSDFRYAQDWVTPVLSVHMAKQNAQAATGEKQAVPSAYDDIPRTHWAYGALDYLADSGTLEGYPEDFFKGDRTLTRYEFAQAVARLLDTVSSRPQEEPEGAWSMDRILAEALRDEFDDQLAELSHVINEPGSIVQ